MRRTGLGVLSDARGLYPRLTARENIVYHGRLHGVPEESAQARCEQLARLLEMEPLLDRRTEGFSQGERMKTALARALVHDPANIVLDEPTNGLDVVATRALRDALRVLRDETGKCIVFSTHIMQEVQRLCDRVVVVSHGRHVADGTVESLCEQAGCADFEDAFVRLAFGPSQNTTVSNSFAAWIVFVKELKDALQDSRTLMVVFVTSVAMGPLVLVLMSTLVDKFEKRAEAREIVAVGLERAPSLRNFLERQTYVIKPAPADWEARLKESKLGDPVVVVPHDFEDERSPTAKRPACSSSTAVPTAVRRAAWAASNTCWRASTRSRPRCASSRAASRRPSWSVSRRSTEHDIADNGVSRGAAHEHAALLRAHGRSSTAR